MRVELQNVTLASQHVRELSALGVGRQWQETVHLCTKIRVSYRVLWTEQKKLKKEEQSEHFVPKKTRTRFKLPTWPRVSMIQF